MGEKRAGTVTSWGTDAELMAALFPVLMVREPSPLRDALLAVVSSYSVEVSDG